MHDIVSTQPIEFIVEGTPVTQGSKDPVVPKYGNGRPVRRHKRECAAFGNKSLARDGMPGPDDGAYVPFECGCPIMVNTLDDNPKLGAWRDQVAWTARMAYKGELLDCLLVVSLEFFKPRPKAHYGTGKNERVLKNTAPAAPGVIPDAGKLARAVEDALTNVVWTDDARIISSFHSKRYIDRWEPEHVKISIRPAVAQTVGDLIELGLMESPHVVEEFEQLDLLAVG